MSSLPEFALAGGGRVLLTVPHMDDDVLACGGTLASMADKTRVFVVYATDGRGSPAPVLPWRDAASPDLGDVREREARAALGHLGIPQDQIHFLALPDGRLRSHEPALDSALRELISAIRPAHLLTPFRFDRHPDHLALNRVVTRAWREGAFGNAGLWEYFVYHRWRLLPRGDIRLYIAPDLLSEADIEAHTALKLEALELFRSQTTRFYAWQTRPNLTPELLSRVSREPEVFLRHDRSRPGAKVFTGSVVWIRLAHRLEPFLKRNKDKSVAILRRVSRRHE